VRGPVTLDTVQPLLEAGGRQFSERDDICVDLAGITAADSSAVGLLIEWTRIALAQRRRIRFQNFTDNLKTLIALYELGALIPGA